MYNYNRIISRIQNMMMIMTYYMTILVEYNCTTKLLDLLLLLLLLL
jgi:hypothetical protein